MTPIPRTCRAASMRTHQRLRNASRSQRLAAISRIGQVCWAQAIDEHRDIVKGTESRNREGVLRDGPSRPRRWVCPCA